MPVGTKRVLDEKSFANFLSLLSTAGYRTIGPRVRDGGIVYSDVATPHDFPIGFASDQEGGRCKLVAGGAPGAFFSYVIGGSTWKRYLFPPSQKILEGKRVGKSFTLAPPAGEEKPYAFIGVRPCELAAIKIQDKVFGYGHEANPEKGIHSDPAYIKRRSEAFLVVVNCSVAGRTCFCTSMGGDVAAKEDAGYDVALTEVIEEKKHHFIAVAGSERGAKILDQLALHEASTADIHDAEAATAKARKQIHRSMVKDVKDLLQRNLRNPRWAVAAERCLACGNCTMVCPTCFCTTVEDTTDLAGDHTARVRSWDSCFTMDFSFIHGGSLRRSVKSRYRHWMTHKLANWHDQFGMSGCVGCGRCIAWCPAGIDITEEAHAIEKNDGQIADP